MDNLAIAIENAVEGCVRETYGAVVGLHQAAMGIAQQLAHAFASRCGLRISLRPAELGGEVA
jgi:hypothetical protein